MRFVDGHEMVLDADDLSVHDFKIQAADESTVTP